VPEEFKIRLSAPGIIAETQINGNGEFILHLLRPGNTATIGELEIVIPDLSATTNAQLFSLDDGCALSSSGRSQAGEVVLKVRNFRTMCSIVFQCKNR
jgi:hypothetical protein